MLRLLKLAWRNLARNRRRTALSLLALMVGVGVMVGLRGFINGIQAALVDRIIQGNVGALQVHRKGYLANVQAMPLTFDMADTPELRARMASVPGVIAVAPRITFGAMVSTPDAPVEGREPTEEEQGRTSFFAATAIDPEQERKVTPMRWEWVGEGTMLSRADARELVLNADFNTGLAAKVTPRAEALPPEDRWPALLAADKEGALNGENVALVGTMLSAAPGDRKYGLVPLAVAQRVLRMEGRVTEYAVGVSDMREAPRIRDALQGLLGPEYEVSTWDELLPFLRTMMEMQDAVFAGVTGVFLLIVLLGIVNTLLMSVLERVREIGTMLAVGMRRSQVVSLFVMEGAVLGVIGGIIGALLGAALTVYLHQRGIHLAAPGSTVEGPIRPFVEPGFVVRAVLLAVALSALAALWPALRASRLRPVEALQSV